MRRVMSLLPKTNKQTKHPTNKTLNTILIKNITLLMDLWLCKILSYKTTSLEIILEDHF